MERKKKPVLTIKNRIFLKVQKIRPAKGVNPFFWFKKKTPFFSLLSFGQIRLQIMLNYLEERKETSFHFKKTAFFKNQKLEFFLFAFGKKMPFFLYLDLIKIRLEIMLS